MFTRVSDRELNSLKPKDLEPVDINRFESVKKYNKKNPPILEPDIFPGVRRFLRDSKLLFNARTSRL
jgi:hypothetical protein